MVNVPFNSVWNQYKISTVVDVCELPVILKFETNTKFLLL